MQTGKGRVIELILQDGIRTARLSCGGKLVPHPGQYLLAGDGSDAPLPFPLYYTESAHQGFITAPPVPESWGPGTELALRGPLGRGFTVPPSARRVALVVFDGQPSRLRGLIQPALGQDAAVVLLGEFPSETLPDEVEVQPITGLPDAWEWADYVAFDIAREDLSGLREDLGRATKTARSKAAQVLIRTPVPCGAMAECGVCAVSVNQGWKMACRDGPVFDLRDLI